MPREPNSRAQLSLYLGLCSFLFHAVTGIPAIVLGAQVIYQIRREKERQPALRKAIGGISIALGGLCASTIAVLLGLAKLQTWKEIHDPWMKEASFGLNLLASHNGGRLPPAILTGADGNADHQYSWRVAILPFIDKSDLYTEYRFDEPWNSHHNLALVSRIPAPYKAPGRKGKLAPPGFTFLHVFAGTDTPFETREGYLRHNIPQRGMKTILVVEGGQAVPWTQPEAIPYSLENRLPYLSTVFPEGFRCASVDNVIHFIPNPTPESTIRALLSVHNGPLANWPDE